VTTNTNTTFLVLTRRTQRLGGVRGRTYEVPKQLELDARSAMNGMAPNTNPHADRVPASGHTRTGATPSRCSRTPSNRRSPRPPLRYKPTDNLTFYGNGCCIRGFLSDGFPDRCMARFAAAPPAICASMTVQTSRDRRRPVSGAKSAFLDPAERERGALLQHRLASGYFFYFDATHTIDSEPSAISTPGTGGERELPPERRSVSTCTQLRHTTARSRTWRDPTVVATTPR